MHDLEMLQGPDLPYFPDEDAMLLQDNTIDGGHAWPLVRTVIEVSDIDTPHITHLSYRWQTFDLII